MEMKSINLQIEKEMYEKLQIIAEHEREKTGIFKIKYSDIIHMAIKKYLEERE